MLKFWLEPPIKFSPGLPLKEKLRSHFDELIHDQPKEWLIKNFSKIPILNFFKGWFSSGKSGSFILWLDLISRLCGAIRG
jgi:hypothetical protein